MAWSTPDGRYRRFSTGKGLITTSGMLVDAERNRVLVCNEDVGVSRNSAAGTRNRVAQVLEFNLDTDALQQTYDLSSLSHGPTLPNDLTLDAQGNIYVTDSFQPQIYKIDRTTRQASILVRSARLMPADAPAAAQGNAALSQWRGVSPGWLPDCRGLHPRAAVEGDVGERAGGQ
ncbi:Uncharacterised protein [Serratia marcescens]|uniref:Gluconolactonase n=1 Tax=Serratia marcescens TaxID=615 RepID=A0A379ZVH6_SERMA|nr:Uncharacterised protein [Serratia marcescens]